MRMMIKFSMPVGSGNAAMRDGRIARLTRQLVEELKPEAAYFHLIDGERGGFMILDMRESAQLAEVAERFFFGLDAKLEMVPVMAADDLQKALSGVQETIRRYG